MAAKDILGGKKKYTSKQADYMELHGAKKDSECEIVKVKNGVSSKLGCCNYFKPNKGTQKFSCGTCRELIKLG